MTRHRTTLTLLVALVALLLASPTAAPAAVEDPGARLNGHAVRLDAQGRLLAADGTPDTAYAEVARRAWEYLLTDVPNDDNGVPAYFSHSYLNPKTQEPVNWPHNPAGLYAMLIESALRWYDFSGDARVVTLARSVADRQLASGMTAVSDSWSHVPYASGRSGSLTYAGAPPEGRQVGSGDGVGVIEPDKVGELGHGFVQLYKVTGEQRYLDAAIDAANALASHRRAGDGKRSIWPFRVRARTDVSVEPYTASVTGPLELFDDLIELGQGDTAAYRASRAALWSWTMTYPMVTDHWSQYFEDVERHVPPDENLNQLTAMTFARYLLEHHDADPQWLEHVRHLIAWDEAVFGERQQGGAMTINEQQAFYHPMGSHTARYGAVNALLAQQTGDATAWDKAYRSLNWATYMASATGVVIDGPTVGNQWFTDGYGDYVRHFLTAMAAAPQVAPDGQTHVLDTTSVLTEVAYPSRSVRYTAFGSTGVEQIKTATAPASVTIDGRRARKTTTGQGWTYDAARHLLTVRRDAATQVVVTLRKARAA